MDKSIVEIYLPDTVAFEDFEESVDDLIGKDNMYIEKSDKPSVKGFYVLNCHSSSAQAFFRLGQVVSDHYYSIFEEVES